MALTTAVGGIFPVVSFLHVPKQMPQPQWLVLGTGFLLHVPSLPTNQSRQDGLLSRIRARTAKKSKTGGGGGEPLLVLSVAHNVAPWRVKEWKLNIPDDWRKNRYILANIYQYDTSGSCLKDTACGLQVEAVHPTLDLTLLSVPDTGAFVRQVAVASAASGHDDDFNLRLGQFKIDALRKKKSGKSSVGTTGGDTADNKKDDDKNDEILVDAIGFRGRGALGDTRIDGEQATKQLTGEERQRMVEEHRNAVGRQDVHVFSFSPEFESTKEGLAIPTGRGFGRQGCPFIGMSGSAVCPRKEVYKDPAAEGKETEKKEQQEESSSDEGGTRVRTACGIFYGGELAKTNMITDGKEEQERGNKALFVPGQDILKWFQEIL